MPGLLQQKFLQRNHKTSLCLSILHCIFAFLLSSDQSRLRAYSEDIAEYAEEREAFIHFLPGFKARWAARAIEKRT
jgi:hypothetical protein